MIWTIGHSTRSLKVFLGLLAHYEVEAVADVRRYPGSHHQPQYEQTALRNTLAEHGIGYRWIVELGGRRRPRPDSPNIAWRNASFRGYAVSTPRSPSADASVGGSGLGGFNQPLGLD